MKQTIQKAIDRINAMSQEEFNAAMEKAKECETYKALKELDEFSNYLFEQEEPK
jgi:hypothetical protein